MENSDSDNKAMENGIDQLLGRKQYKSVPLSDRCEHEDDGYIYGENMTRVTLRCQLCGIYFEQRK